MATIEQRLDRWEMRQEAMIASLDGIVNVLETIRDSQTELAKWLAKPPSSDLPEVLKALVTSVHTLIARMDALPADVARVAPREDI